MERATAYANQRQFAIRFDTPLGSGTDESVWTTARKTAVKVFHRPSNCHAELESYRRLSDASITEIDIFAVPTLIDADHGLLVVEMSSSFWCFLRLPWANANH